MPTCHNVEMAHPGANILITPPPRLRCTEANMLADRRVVRMFLVRRIVNPNMGATEDSWGHLAAPAMRPTRQGPVTVSKLVMVTIGR